MKRTTSFLGIGIAASLATACNGGTTVMDAAVLTGPANGVHLHYLTAGGAPGSNTFVVNSPAWSDASSQSADAYDPGCGLGYVTVGDDTNIHCGALLTIAPQRAGDLTTFDVRFAYGACTFMEVAGSNGMPPDYGPQTVTFHLATGSQSTAGGNPGTIGNCTYTPFLTTSLSAHVWQY